MVFQVVSSLSSCVADPESPLQDLMAFFWYKLSVYVYPPYLFPPVSPPARTPQSLRNEAVAQAFGIGNNGAALHGIDKF